MRKMQLTLFTTALVEARAQGQRSFEFGGEVWDTHDATAKAVQWLDAEEIEVRGSNSPRLSTTNPEFSITGRMVQCEPNSQSVDGKDLQRELDSLPAPPEGLANLWGNIDYSGQEIRMYNHMIQSQGVEALMHHMRSLPDTTIPGVVWHHPPGDLCNSYGVDPEGRYWHRWSGAHMVHDAEISYRVIKLDPPDQAWEPSRIAPTFKKYVVDTSRLPKNGWVCSTCTPGFICEEHRR